MSKERNPFFKKYIQEGLVDWQVALDIKKDIEERYRPEFENGNLDVEFLESYEARKVWELQQATEKISKGLLLMYGGTLIIPFMLIATLRGFDKRHPRHMEELENIAEEYFRSSALRREVESLGHTPISKSKIPELLEKLQQLYRKYFHEYQIAKCYKAVENYIRSGLKDRTWDNLWKIVLECEKTDLRKYGRDVLSLTRECLSDEGKCNEIKQKLGVILEKPYIVNFSLVLVEEYIKELLDLMLATTYLEPVSSVARYGAMSPQDEIKRKVLLDAVSNQEKLISFLEVKIRIVKNLLGNDEIMENLETMYNFFEDVNKER